MRFLVIGASGFVGRHVLASAKNAGHEAVGTQSGNKFKGLVAYDLGSDSIAESVGRSFFSGGGPVFGVICAAIRQIDQCALDRERSRMINVEKTIGLIEELGSLGATPVYVSSSFVFNGKKGYYTEDDGMDPVCEYGRQKAEVERYMARSPERSLVLRLDKVVGDDPQEEHLFSEWYRLVRENRTIPCIGGQVFSPTLAGDIGRAAVLACEKKFKGVYHLANPEFFCREELARQFCYALGKRPDVVSRPVDEFGFSDTRPLKTYLDSSRFMDATGMRFTSMRKAFDVFKAKV